MEPWDTLADRGESGETFCSSHCWVPHLFYYWYANIAVPLSGRYLRFLRRVCYVDLNMRSSYLHLQYCQWAILACFSRILLTFLFGGSTENQVLFCLCGVSYIDVCLKMQVSFSWELVSLVFIVYFCCRYATVLMRPVRFSLCLLRSSEEAQRSRSRP